jgi:hypothetical protein
MKDQGKIEIFEKIIFSGFYLKKKKIDLSLRGQTLLFNLYD